MSRDTKKSLAWACVAVLLIAAPAAAQTPLRQPPQIGYSFPAGGQQGQTFEITVGGQNFASVNQILVSGKGVQAEFLEYIGPLRQSDLMKIRDIFDEARKQVTDANKAQQGGPPAVRTKFLELAKEKGITEKQIQAFDRDRERRNDKKRQPNPQLVDTLKVKVAIAVDAAPGIRELRVLGRTGLSNPVRFVVGTLPEMREDEAADKAYGAVKVPALPIVLNGQIMPGDVDHFRFPGKRGQKLVIDVSARRLVPYLADAVPGWFQALAALYDAQGREVAYADDFRFDPDPLLVFDVPRDGEYVLEIRDAIYRGREDFVYRVAVGELPLVTDVFPLGGPVGGKTAVSLQGWNLPADRTLDVTPTSVGIMPLSIKGMDWTPRTLRFAAGDLPERLENGRNDSARDAQMLTPPCIVNGRIEREGDWDVFRFRANKGERIAAEVYARRLGSPLDSLLKVTAPDGKVLAMNDDCVDPGEGMLTHYADSCLLFEPPSGGEYLLWLGDAQGKGGLAFAYRLRVSAARPDFELRAAPSAVNLRGGETVPIEVFALRRDGFDGDIRLRLTGEAKGFVLSGRLPAGQDKVRLTLTAPPKTASRIVTLGLEGAATVGGREIRHAAVPADDVMQAFAYHHLVPAEEWVAAVDTTRAAPSPWPKADDSPIRLQPGRTATVTLKTPAGRPSDQVRLELSDPPDGVSLKKVKPVTGGLELTFDADAAKVKPGLKGNLIVSAFLEPRPPTTASSQPLRPSPPVPLGSLPAMPFEVMGK